MSTPELADRYLMQTGRRLPVTFDRGRGCLVYDDAGREYLDLVAGIAVNVLGHAHPEAAAAVASQAHALIHAANPSTPTRSSRCPTASYTSHTTTSTRSKPRPTSRPSR